MPSSARLSPARLLPALVLLVAFLAIGFAIQSGPLPGDRFVGDRLTGVALPLMRGVSTLASLPVWSALVLLVAVVLWRQGWRLDATWLVAADVTAELVGLVGKLLFNRPRPEHADGRRARDVHQESDLTTVVARPERRDQRAIGHHLGSAGADDVEAVARLTLVDEGGTRLEGVRLELGDQQV